MRELGKHYRRKAGKETAGTTNMSDKAVDGAALEPFLARIAAQQPDRREIVFVCIGSDRSTGDSLGPLAGSALARSGWPGVVGTLDKPCDADALSARLEPLSDSEAGGRKVVIAIDACLGKAQSIGRFLLAEGSLLPGSALGKRLPAVGDYSIAGIVNEAGHKPYWMLQSASLKLVMDMAEQLVAAINSAWRIDYMTGGSDDGGK